jgi:hypothetical protein
MYSQPSRVDDLPNDVLPRYLDTDQRLRAACPLFADRVRHEFVPRALNASREQRHAAKRHHRTNYDESESDPKNRPVAGRETQNYSRDRGEKKSGEPLRRDAASEPIQRLQQKIRAASRGLTEQCPRPRHVGESGDRREERREDDAAEDQTRGVVNAD